MSGWNIPSGVPDPGQESEDDPGREPIVEDYDPELERARASDDEISNVARRLRLRYGDRGAGRQARERVKMFRRAVDYWERVLEVLR